MRVGSKIFLVLAGLLAATAVQAVDVYRWKDDRGRTVYSDTPPVGRAFTKIALQPGGGGIAVPDASAPAEKPPLDAAVINAKAKEQNKRIMEVNCRTAKENLTMVSKPLPPGAKSTPAREDGIRRAQEDVKTWCQ